MPRKQFTLTEGGMQRFTDQYRKRQNQTISGAILGVKQAGRYFIKDARKLTPFLTGDLRRSYYVRVISAVRGKRYNLHVGLNMHYAQIQHDTDWFYHPYGRAFYLTAALGDWRATAKFAYIVQKEIHHRGIIGSGNYTRFDNEKYG